MLKAVEKTGDEEDRNMQFFRGILPTIKRFDDHQIVDFQMGVLQVIKNIQNTVPIPAIQPQQPLIIANPYSQQYTQQYPCTVPSQNSQSYTSADFSYTPLLSRISNEGRQRIASNTISHVAKLQSISCPSTSDITSTASEDTQSTVYSSDISPFSPNSDIDF